MRKSRFTEEQIAYALRQVESGTPATALCRKLGISVETFYRWKAQVRRDGGRRAPAGEAARGGKWPAQAAVADLTHDKVMLQDVLTKAF
jgi:putative transposase